MKDILVVCPQSRDLKAIESARLGDRFRIHYAGTDLDAVDDLDARAFVEACDAIPADGVVGTKDRSALLAALIAARRGLPGPRPEALVACQFKLTARALQRAAAPDATPRFALLDGRPPFDPPFFVKPVVGRLSQHVRRIDDPAELAGLGDRDSYMESYARIAKLAGLHPEAVRGFLAEELLAGDEVTVEGYVRDGEVHVIGVTDSVKYPGTNSFERFEYPSAHPTSCQRELAEIVSRVVEAHGLDHGFFNAEFFLPASGSPQLIELNGRIASQFWWLVEAVDGRSTYEALFTLASGNDPGWTTPERAGVAVSYVRRTFSDAFVRAVPRPETDVEVLVRPGRLLSEHGPNDAQSFRLCIAYAWARRRADAVARARARAERLRFDLDPVNPALER